MRRFTIELPKYANHGSLQSSKRKVNMKTELKKEAGRIADAIVELVERSDGPVTLCKVAREVTGFAKEEPPSWDYFIKHDGKETLYWCGMTEGGFLALQAVMRGRRVAVQPVNELPYVVDDGVIARDNWQPIVLLPAKAANLDSPKWLLRVSPLFQGTVKDNAGFRILRPEPVGGTADGFSL
jgi:hypothetical protein